MNIQQAESVTQSIEVMTFVDEEAHHATTLSSPEHAWVMLLSMLPYQRQSRILYCVVLKPWLDVIFAAVLLLVLSPLLFGVALALWLADGGPVFFKHQRIGRYGKPFMMYKFRTMIHDRRRQNGVFDGLDRRVSHKTRHDPRVTRLGRLLRATSIDELPQFWNVVCGDMSFIGPRPELPDIVRRYAPWQHQRHLVRPGLSGWWQVHGRSDLPMHEHTGLDMYYVVNQSFLLDAQVVAKTLRVLLQRSGAY